MLQIGSGDNHIQLIMDEPPDRECSDWCNSRIEFYKRVEPNAPLRDVAPDTKSPAKNRIRFSGLASAAVWKVILSNPEQKTLEDIAKMGSIHELSAQTK